MDIDTGSYWTSSINLGSSTHDVYVLSFGQDWAEPQDYAERGNGFAVRWGERNLQKYSD